MLKQKLPTTNAYYLRNNISTASTQNAVMLAKTQRANFDRFSWLIFGSLKKIRNTYQIWLKMNLFDGEFIGDCVKVKAGNNQRLLAEK